MYLSGMCRARGGGDGWLICWWTLFLLSLHCFTFGLSREAFIFIFFTALHTHTETWLCLLASTWMCGALSWRPRWQGRYTTSGHLTSLGSEWGWGPPVGWKLSYSASDPSTAIAGGEGGGEEGRGGGGGWRKGLQRQLNMCLLAAAGLCCQSRCGGNERSSSEGAQSSSGLWGAVPDGRPVVWLSVKGGMLRSRVSDGGRTRWM